MKKLIGIVLTLCILSALVVPVYATGNDYPYIDTNPSIITPDSFEETFSVEEIDRVSYDYEMIIPEGNQKALISLQMEIKVGNNAYLSSAVGNVRSHVLPSGDVLWHGPISGSITIDGEEFKITAGFSKFESTGEVMISITIQIGYEMIAFSFGNNIIRGEVLKFFSEKASASQQYGQQPGLSVDQDLSASAINSQNNESSLLSFPDLTVNPGIFDGDGGGGGGYPSLGEYNEFAFQDRIPAYHGNAFSYKAAESRVYWDSGKNIILVTTKPYCQMTQNYVNTLGYDVATSSLESFSISLSLDPNAPASSYAVIIGIYVPSEFASSYINNQISIEKDYFGAFLTDVLSVCGVPTETLLTILADLEGEISAYHNPSYANVTVDMEPSGFLFDELPEGFLTKFNLIATDDLYEGNTEYTVTTTITYSVLTQTNVFLSDPIYNLFYIEKELVHSGKTVDI